MKSHPDLPRSASDSSVVDLLTFVQRSLTRELASVFAEDGIGVEQWRILRSLAGEEGRTMGDLAAQLEIPGPTLTRAVDALIESAHLYRTQSRRDRRRVSVHLSSRGEQLLERLDSQAAAHEAGWRERLPSSTMDNLDAALLVMRRELS